MRDLGGNVGGVVIREGKGVGGRRGGELPLSVSVFFIRLSLFCVVV